MQLLSPWRLKQLSSPYLVSSHAVLFMSHNFLMHMIFLMPAEEFVCGGQEGSEGTAHEVPPGPLPCQSAQHHDRGLQLHQCPDRAIALSSGAPSGHALIQGELMDSSLKRLRPEQAPSTIPAP